MQILLQISIHIQGELVHTRRTEIVELKAMNTKLIIVLVSICFKWVATQDLKHHLVLDENDTYHLFWSVDGENITIEVQVATKGYVGFGFSSNGSMPGSDIVIGWILPNGQAYFHDRHALGYYEPLIDTEQNYNLINAYENETHTVLRFTRKLNTCDEENDTVITDSTMRIIYSWHPDDPTAVGSVQYHGPHYRGAKSNYILSPPIPPELTDDISIWEIQIPNVNIPPKIAGLVCFDIKTPPFKEPHYFVGYTIEVPPEVEGLLHHMGIFPCYGNSTYNEEKYGHPQNGYPCDDTEMVMTQNNCKSQLIGWGVGVKWESIPKGVGRKLVAPYYITNLHYTNFDKIQGIVDRTTIHAYLTKEEITSEPGILVVNVSSDYTLLIPPHQLGFQISTYCPSECTSMSFPKEGINVFATATHAHLLAVKLSIRHFRDNKELKPILDETNYDFEYEEMRNLQEIVKIMPGDMLMATCAFSSEGKNETVLGGLATTDEMCLFQLHYYPTANLTLCSWKPNYEDIFKFFGVNEIAEDKVHIISPAALQNQTMFDVIKHYNWTTVDEAKMNRLTSILYDGDKNITCSSHLTLTETDIIAPVSYPIDIPPYIPPLVCETTSNATNAILQGT